MRRLALLAALGLMLSGCGLPPAVIVTDLTIASLGLNVLSGAVSGTANIVNVIEKQNAPTSGIQETGK